MRVHSSTSAIYAFVILMLLAACGDVNQKVSLYKDGVWEAEIALTYSNELVEANELLGDFAVDVEQQIRTNVANMEASGVDVTWQSSQEGGELRYVIAARGNDLATLRAALFDELTQVSLTEVNGQQQIRISRPVGLDLNLGSYTLTLVGSEILSSNGQQIDKGTVRWVNPVGPIEATLTPKSRLNSAFLYGLVGLVGIVFVVVAVQRIQQRNRGSGVCRHCSTWLDEEAEYCYHCGKRR